MAGFVMRGFRGMRPIVDSKLLDPSEAQEALDVRLSSGNIEPVEDNTTVVAMKSLVPSAVQTIFRARDNVDETLNWFEFTEDVDVVRSPITQDSYNRLYWTGQDVFRYAPETIAFAAGSGAYPRNSYTVGIPKPTVVPLAAGVSVYTPTTADRTYVITYTNSDGSKESAPSEEVTVKSLTANVDIGTVQTSSFTYESATSYRISCPTQHGLIAGDFIGITGASDADWNKTWEVAAVVDVKTFTIKNTQSFPASPPSGTYAVKRRYPPKVKLFGLPTDNSGNLDIINKRIYRKVSNVFRLVATIPLSDAEYTDLYLDSDLSGAATLASSVENRPARPTIAPTAVIPFNDTSVTPGSVTIAHVYAIAFVTLADVEGPLSKSSAVVKVVNGVTVANINHNENVATDVTKKRIYRQTVTYSGTGTYTVSDAAYHLVAEVPVSQTSYSDAAADAAISGNAGAAVLGGIDEPPGGAVGAFGAVGVLTPKATAESRVYVYTYVSEYGEEGPPSDPSTLIDINPSEPVLITMGGVPNGNYNITKKYLYRTSTGTTTTDYQFVAEIPVATTTYYDYKKQAELGEVIPSVEWEPPPTNLKGLKVMANGIFVGFSGRDICFSEPYMPHAWSSKNFLPIDGKPVGLGAFGQSIAILTDSFPYIATGVDPASMSLVKTSFQQACISKRSIVEAGDSVIYASPDGLAQIGLGGVSVLTSKILSQKQWQEYNPSSIHAYLHEGRYYAFYTKTDNTKGMLVFNLLGSDAPFTLGSETTNAGHVVPTADSLHIVKSGNIVKMDKAATKKTYSWKSKVFEATSQVNFGVAQVMSSDFTGGCTFKLYADGVLKITKIVTSSEPFRLPSGYLARNWYAVVEGSAPIQMIAIAQSMAELKAI